MAISDICNFSEVMHGVRVKTPTFMPAALEHVNPLNLKLLAKLQPMLDHLNQAEDVK
ncbi:unnamed protein product [Camellia sinensis]